MIETILSDMAQMPAWVLLALAALLFAGVLIGLLIARFAGAGRSMRLSDDDVGWLEEHFARLERSGREEGAAARLELSQGISSLGSTLRQDLAESRATLDRRLDEFGRLQGEAAGAARSDLRESVGRFGEGLKNDLGDRMALFQKALSDRQSSLEESLAQKHLVLTTQVGELMRGNSEAQEKLRVQVDQKLDVLRQSNEAKLEQMRLTVDEKLQGTLEKRLGESFKLVSERLEHVQRGLGEMQVLAVGVGDLKRVLSNVKDRGGWAEIRLGSLLEQILTRDQYEANHRVNPASNETVEFAIRLPGRDDEGDVFLPVDAKFPKEDYERLEAAWESGDRDGAIAASEAVARAIETEAKRISSKYIVPPHSTDFAVMFLPTEGLFAEAMRMPGLAERVQTKYRVTLTGPTTLAALLNSLQMGFRTLAIQKRSSEVWQVLGHAKAEFQRYAGVWEKLQKQLATAQNTVEEAGKRTRAVERRLRGIETAEPLDALEGTEAGDSLDEDGEGPGADGPGAEGPQGPPRLVKAARS